MLLLPIFSSYERIYHDDPLNQKLEFCGERRMVYIPFRERMWLDYLSKRLSEAINKLDFKAIDYWHERFLSYQRRLYEHEKKVNQKS